MAKKKEVQSPGGTSSSGGLGVSKWKTCKALTTSGNKCKRPVAPGLTVCTSHGGGTRASRKKSREAKARQKAHSLWGISKESGSLSIEEELTQLARNKRTDIIAIRIEVGSDPEKYYGLLLDSEEESDSDVSGYSSKRVKRSGVHPLVNELHKAESEYVAILKLLHEVTGGTDDVDMSRVTAQAAREAARLMRAFPGISVEDVALQVSRRG